MKQSSFEDKYRESWHTYVQLLDELEGIRDKSEEHEDLWHSFPARYRKICQHYSAAQDRQYSPVLNDYLHQLVLRGHRFLYKQKSSAWSQLFSFLHHGFPQALRREWRVWLLSSVLFYVPAVFMGIMCYLDSEFLYSLVEYNQVQEIESMYDPVNKNVGRTSERQGDSDFMMFGYYIMNNVGIDFKAYATGLLFGLGSIFFMVFNGLFIGGVAGHLTNKGFIETFWPFVSGHSALELTAATIAGAAGLKLGYALINPKNLTRMLALQQAGRDTFPLIAGAALMTFLAAFVEGFWSGTPWVSNSLKYSVGTMGWLAVFSYLLFAGRKHGAR